LHQHGHPVLPDFILISLTLNLQMMLISLPDLNVNGIVSEQPVGLEWQDKKMRQRWKQRWKQMIHPSLKISHCLAVQHAHAARFSDMVMMRMTGDNLTKVGLI
jgi:hypothetical protein